LYLLGEVLWKYKYSPVKAAAITNTANTGIRIHLGLLLLWYIYELTPRYYRKQNLISLFHKHYGMPRNKAYESLERLLRRGMVEIQQGRPTLYRAMGAKAIINSLLEDYSKEATEALGVLEKMQEDAKEEGEYSIMNASAWMVRGELGVKRRLAELIYGAKEDIFAIGGYPPKYLLAVKTALKAATKRGVKIRPISMIRPSEDAKVSSDDSSVFGLSLIQSSASLFFL
jgi:sugar-specific transcriptional regulator TrmB